MLKAVIFDLWGVLGTKPSLRKKLVSKFGFTSDETFLRKYEAAIQRVEHDTIQDLAVSFCSHFGIVCDEDNLEYVMQAVETVVEECVVMPGIKEVLEALHKNYRLAILSNTTNFESTAPVKWGLALYFDDAVYSWQTGYSKPERKAFEAALERLGLDVRECLFIDNKEENVNAAQQLGMKAIHFKNIEQLKHDLTEHLG